MSKAVDINVDIGEGFPFDWELLDYATSANVCCGEHAGSWELTKEAVTHCRIKEVRIGMHPGFPDRDTMGRARIQEDEVAQYANSIFEQALRFQEYVPEVAFIKPHGAWYSMLVEHSHPSSHLYRACRLMLDGVVSAVSASIMLLHGSPAAVELAGEGLFVIREGFADRRYEEDGTLRSRSQPEAVLTDFDEIRKQVLRLARTVDSICIHGDSPGCVEIARLVYESLEQGGYEVGY